MRSSPVWIAAASGLVIGAGLGLCCARGPAIAAAHDSEAAAPLAPAPLDAHAAEIAQLRAELEQWRAAASESRTPHTPAARADALAARAPSSAPAPVAAAGALGADLQAEIDALAASGALAAFLGRNPDGLPGFLVQAWLAAGDPERAFALLERYPQGAESYADVASALRNSGDRAEAARALLLGLELHADNFDWRDQRWGASLTELAPAEALAGLERWVAEHGDSAELKMHTRMAALLAALGRGGEARALVERAFATGQPNELAWTTIAKLDPERAEALMRAAVAAAPGDWTHTARLVGLLAETGRGGEAAELVERQARERGDWGEPLQWLSERFPERAEDCVRALLKQQMQGAPTGPLYSALGRALEKQARLPEAVAAWEQAIASGDDGDAWAGLQRVAPQRFLAMLEQRAEQGDDESWGDLGDQYWSAGRTSDAERAWARASALDPGDGEWSQKLALLRGGRDPLTGALR